ncbi:MAG: hypothetical protein ACRD8A_13525 [Candidatus Acidiferrales bacterium]
MSAAPRLPLVARDADPVRIGGGVVIAGPSRVLVTMGDDDFFARLVPLTVVVDAREGADGADDGVGGGDDGLGLLDQEAEGVAGLLGSKAEEAEGVSVAVDDAAVGEIEFVGDGGWAMPVKDRSVDVLAFRVIADGALGRVIVGVDVVVRRLDRAARKGLASSR